MKANSITEVTGKSGQLFGLVPVQAHSPRTLRLTDSVIISREKTFFNLETQEVTIPIQEIRGIQTGEGITWWLVWLGFLTLAVYVGIIFIILGIVLKQRYLVVYTSSVHLILFYKETQKIEPFKAAILATFQSQNINSRRPPMPPPAYRPNPS